MLHCDPEVGGVSWQSIWSCRQFSYGHFSAKAVCGLAAVMAMPRVWFGCSSHSV